MEVLYVWLSGQAKMGAYAVANVGIVLKGFPPFSYLFLLGLTKYVVVTVITAICFFYDYKKETAPLRKKQLRLHSLLFFVSVGGVTEWLTGFDIPLHLAWIFMPIFIGVIGYSIIRYKSMEIDTVIHRTIMWAVTLFILVMPGGAIGLILAKKLIPSASIPVDLLISCAYLIFFVFYYNHLRPRIDHFFRRRKYDYQTILGKVAERIATSINIEELTRSLLTEVCEAMYLRNALLYIQVDEGKRYDLRGRMGYKENEGIRQYKELELISEESVRSFVPGGQRQIDYFTSNLCQWLVEHQDVMEKEQLELDPQYSSLKDEALRWLNDHDIEIIVPLVFERKLQGVLCLGKKETLHNYTVKDIELLKKLGQEAGVTVFNALHHEDLKEKERMDEELRMGRQIQNSLLPKESPVVPLLKVCGLMVSAKEIGGDYYDFIKLPTKDNLAIVIGDVSGRGVAAGLLMAMVKATIHTLSKEGFKPMHILTRANQILCQHIGGDQKFMTLLYLVWDPLTRGLSYSSAGHEFILVYRNGSEKGKPKVETIISGGFLLGVWEDIEEFLDEKVLTLSPEDKVVLYTDGVTEARNIDNEFFSIERLTQTIEKNGFKPADELLDSIKEEVYNFIGKREQHDDITLVVMEAR